MEEIEIKVEYIDTFARDPLSHRPGKRAVAETCSNVDWDGGVSGAPDNVAETVPNLSFPVLPRISSLTHSLQLHEDDKLEDRDSSKQLSNTPAKQVTWYRHINQFGKLQCKYCDLTYSIPQTLRVHVKNKHPKEAATLRLAIKQTQNTPKFVCQLCNKIFPTQDTLKSHTDSKLNLLASGTFICDYCASVHLSKDEIIEHIYKLHMDSSGNFFKKIRRKVCEVRKFQCPYCAHFAKRRYGLTTHIRAKHKTEDDMKFACPHCAHRTSIKYYLQSHIASNHPESDYARSKRRYVCDVCAYGTTKKSHYQQHRKKHFLKEREHKCEFCNYETNYRANLNVHKRTHTQEKPYKCDYQGCYYKCAAKTALNSHKIKHNPECHIWYCDKCNYKTVYKNSLKKHVDSHRRNRKGV